MSRTSRRRRSCHLGFVSVRVMADYGSSGLWLTYPAGVFRHSGISCEALRLPPALAAQFATWIDTYYGSLEAKTFGTDDFNQHGRNLARELKAYLGADSYVKFVAEDADGGILAAEVITLSA